MIGRKQEALIIHKYQKNLLVPYSYYLILDTISQQEYNNKETKFSLCIDDFSIKYQPKQDADYLCDTIRVNFKYTVNNKSKNYCRLTLDQY